MDVADRLVGPADRQQYAARGGQPGGDPPALQEQADGHGAHRRHQRARRDHRLDGVDAVGPRDRVVVRRAGAPGRQRGRAVHGEQAVHDRSGGGDGRCDDRQPRPPDPAAGKRPERPAGGEPHDEQQPGRHGEGVEQRRVRLGPGPELAHVALHGSAPAVDQRLEDPVAVESGSRDRRTPRDGSEDVARTAGRPPMRHRVPLPAVAGNDAHCGHRGQPPGRLRPRAHGARAGPGSRSGALPRRTARASARRRPRVRGAPRCAGAARRPGSRRRPR